MTIYQKNTDTYKKLKLKFTKYDSLNILRIARRLFRTNKCNLVRINQDYLCVFRQHKILLVELKTGRLHEIFAADNTRNVMANSFHKFGNKGIIFGDYYANPTNAKVFIHYTEDVFQKPIKRIDIQKIVKCRHIHNIQYISETSTTFVTTGDFDGECWILEFDNQLNLKTVHGDGSQTFRACGIHYFKDSLFWGMDSPLSPPQIIGYDYTHREINFSKNLPGPCWYSVEYLGKIILSTADEPSSLKLDASIVVFDPHTKKIESVQIFKKDLWPYFLKYGTISLKLSECKSILWANFEAIRWKDGKSIRINNVDGSNVF